MRIIRRSRLMSMLGNLGLSEGLRLNDHCFDKSR